MRAYEHDEQTVIAFPYSRPQIWQTIWRLRLWRAQGLRERERGRHGGTQTHHHSCPIFGVGGDFITLRRREAAAAASVPLRSADL